MGKTTRKYVIFDLDNSELKGVFGKKNFSNSYHKIRRYLEKNGYEHTEGSVYLSKAPVARSAMVELYDNLIKEFPWIDSCSKAIHFADAINNFEVSELFDNEHFVETNEQATALDNIAFDPQGKQNTTEHVKSPRKYVVFDLDTKELKAYLGEKNFTKAYDQIRSIFEKNGFKHVQGSGYLSSKPCSRTFAKMVLMNLQSEFPWFETSVKALHVADVGRQYNLKTFGRSRVSLKAKAEDATAFSHEVWKTKPTGATQKQLDESSR